MPNIAAIPRTDASNTMNCFPRLLIVSGISDQACLEGIIIYLSVLLRYSHMKLIKCKKNMKQNWVILAALLAALSSCIVRRKNTGGNWEFQGSILMWTEQGRGKGTSVLLPATPPRHMLCAVPWELVIIEASSYLEATQWAPPTACALSNPQHPPSRELSWQM